MPGAGKAIVASCALVTLGVTGVVLTVQKDKPFKEVWYFYVIFGLGLLVAAALVGLVVYGR